jgi:hypothetical protein
LCALFLLLSFSVHADTNVTCASTTIDNQTVIVCNIPVTASQTNFTVEPDQNSGMTLWIALLIGTGLILYLLGEVKRIPFIALAGGIMIVVCSFRLNSIFFFLFEFIGIVIIIRSIMIKGIIK